MKNTLIFLGGAAVGGLAATLYFKKKMIILEEDYQRIANDEINKYIGESNSSVKNIDEIEVKRSHDDEHTTRTLTAFTDKVVLDEDNCLFDINYFGKDIMKTLYSKKNLDSSIFVRDDNEKVDYEIIKEKISFENFNKLTDSEDK